MEESMSFEVLKERGNDYVKQKKYEDALKFYSAALKLRPTEHTIYSNRSLAHLRVDKVEEALSDADKCVQLCPNFARGHMRRAVSLNVLQKYDNAKEAAVTGYLLRGSDSIGKECISQWLIANQHLYKSFYMAGGLPTGTVIVSDDYIYTLMRILKSRASSSFGMTSTQMKEHLLAVASQLKQLLVIFGHSDNGCLQKWIEELTTSSEINPQSSALSKTKKDSVTMTSKEVAKWINKDIDPVLYPIVRPCLILAVMVVLSRTYVLNCMNLGHENIQLLSQACLVLFEHSILDSKEYMGHHLGTITGLLDSFIGRGAVLTSDDLGIMKHYCDEVDRLLPLYEATAAWEYKELRDIAIRVVANIRSELSSKMSGEVKWSSRLPQGCMMSGEVAKKDALKFPAEVCDYMENLIKEIRAKNPAELLRRDGENLIHGSVGLMKLQKPQKALEAFVLGEEVHLNILTLQAKRGVWTLEEIPSFISTTRNDVLLTAFALRELDTMLLPRVLVRWKCFYSELRAMLLYFGLKNDYARSFNSIDSLRRDLTVTKETKAQAFTSIMKQHQQGQKLILKKWGPYLISLLFQQSLEMVQRVLEPNEVILDITLIGRIAEDVDKPELTGALLLIPPKGNCIFEIANFNDLGHLSREWSKELTETFNCLESDKQVYHQQLADKIGAKIRNVIFPLKIESAISCKDVSCLYICPDMPLNNLPLHLLPWADGKLLFEICSISYLSCCREVLREWCISAVQSYHIPEEDANVNPVCGNATITKSLIEHNPVTNSINTDCVIFANPDFDLQSDSADSSLWEILKQSLGLISKEHKKKVKPLAKSLQEADEITYLFSIANKGVIKPLVFSGQNATILNVLQVKSPLILHFSTHGFSQPSGDSICGGNFWTDMTTGLALAGINTYRFEDTTKILPDAGTGELTAIAVCGMDLKRTRLVYLSTCVSSIGFVAVGESVGSLSQAFRAAGAETVIATLWPVMDDAARKFAIYFYDALSKPQTKPSEAINRARQQLRQEVGFEHWFYWGPFVSIGYNSPLFLD